MGADLSDGRACARSPCPLLAGLFFVGNEKMKLVENWRALLAGSWSVWFFGLIALITGAEVLLSQFGPGDLGLSPLAYKSLVMIVAIVGPLARILQQNIGEFIKDESGAPCLRRRTIGIAVAGGLAASIALVGQWEGLRTQAYRDVIGVWTVCYGETKGVEPGDRYTKAECDQMLERELRAYAAGLGKCLKAELPEGAATAFLSWSYNVGTGAACKSTLVRKANAGDLFGACDELLRWNRAGGRVVPGLSNRRKDEHRLCVASLQSVGMSRPARQ